MSPIVGDLAIEVYEGAPFATGEWRATAHATLSLILDGAAMDGEAVLLPGTVSYRPAGCHERLTFGASGCTVVQISVNASRLVPFGLLHPRRARIRDHAMVGQRIRSEMRRRDAAAPLALRSAALDLVGRAIRLLPNDTPPTMVTAAREVIAARFRERIRAHDVAAAVGVTPAALAKAFRREGGASVTGAIRAARIEAAVDALAKSTGSTATIAAQCGFYDASHLIRTLDASLGARPAGFRERSRP